MPAETSAPYDIAEASDHLEVRGVSRREMTEALDLLDKVRAVQAEHVSGTRDALLVALMIQKVDLIPPPSLAQTQRLATNRAALLATPVFTNESLREFRGDTSESSTRTWLSRHRDRHKLFTVAYKGKTLVPAFQLDEYGEPREELQPILSTLVEAGVQGWSLWTWLISPSSLLSGGIPEQLARTAPERVLRATRRFAAPPAA